MGKRKRHTEEYIQKKIRKLEKKLEAVATGTPPLTSGVAAAPAPLDTPTRPQSPQADTDAEHQQQNLEDVDDAQLPEDYLLALGHEGEDKTEIGEAIRAELALRWSNIMNAGLTKEDKENILKKYPTPENFKRAVAPILNPEIEASISDLTQKRDKRIINRQNMIGKIMSSLGKVLTNILKGDINTKKLVEQVNDAAKIAAEVFYQDSSSRKFFALAGANPIVREAVRTEITDELLFGKGCAEKIKAAQTITKTGSQIKNDAAAKAKSSTATPKVQGNWKGPPRYPQQQYRGARGGHRQQPAPPPPSQRRNYYQPQRQRDQKRQNPYRSRTSYRR